MLKFPLEVFEKAGKREAVYGMGSKKALTRG
jgi:hypothetical protein